MLTKHAFYIPTYQERGQSVHIHSLSAVIHQKGSYSASKQRFLTVVLESRSLLDSQYGRLCTIRNAIDEDFWEF